jgi:hypothetical protein
MYGITLTPQLLKIAAVVALVIGLIVSFQFAQHSAEQRGYTKAQNEYTQKALIASAFELLFLSLTRAISC